MRQHWRPSARWGFATAVAVIGAALVVGLLVRELSWNSTDGRITRLNVDVEVQQDGTLRIEEQTRLRFDAAEASPSVERLLRTYGQGRNQRVSDVRLVGSDDRTLRPDEDRLLRDLRLRFELPGDAENPVRTYALTYTVSGAATPLGDQTVVERDLLGSGLRMPVDGAEVVIHGATAATVSCLTGPSDGRRFCASTGLSDDQATVGEPYLDPDEGLAFSVRLEPSLADVAPVELSDPPTSFGTTVVVRLSLVLLLLLAIGVFATMRQRSRPRTWRRVSEEPVGVRPAEAGVLLAGAAEARHLTATLLDLVRRGFIDMRWDSGNPGAGTVGSDADAVLRQNSSTGRRDELALYEWSFMLKLFEGPQRRSIAATDEYSQDVEEARLSEVRAAAPRWSWELLRELERQVVENNRWRHSDGAARMQRLGWLVALGVGVLGYVGLVAMSVLRWPDLPTQDLIVGAVVTLVWAFGCADLLSRTASGMLTFRGRLLYAEIDAWAKHVNRRGVDDDDPAMGIWAIGLGVRPDLIEFPVVPPSARPQLPPDDDELDEFAQSPREVSESDPYEPDDLDEADDLDDLEPDHLQPDEPMAEVDGGAEPEPDMPEPDEPAADDDGRIEPEPKSEPDDLEHTNNTDDTDDTDDDLEDRTEESGEVSETSRSPAYSGRIFDDDDDAL